MGSEYLWMKGGAGVVMFLHVLGSLGNFTEMWKSFQLEEVLMGVLKSSTTSNEGLNQDTTDEEETPISLPRNLSEFSFD